MNDISKSCLYSTSFIEALYEQYLKNPEEIAPEWQDYFRELQSSQPQSKAEVSHSTLWQKYRKAAGKKIPVASSTKNNATANSENAELYQKQVAVLQLINAHRFRGHHQANLDPLKQHSRPGLPELEPEYYGLTQADMDKNFNTGSLFAENELPLRDIVSIGKNTYCQSIGAEYMYLNDTEQKRWIQERLETMQGKPEFDNDKKKRILERIIAATSLEEYLHMKYVGQKRFSLEGGEPLIPLLDELVQHSGSAYSIHEIVIGMAHRGRLNVLVNTIGKKPEELFDEFEGKSLVSMSGTGDVKYHMGYSSDIATSKGSIHLTLAFNPSHLEIIDPVVEGSVRARQERRVDTERNHILPLLLHGDAAFAGQGVVMETFNLSQVRGYTTGGTVHIVINNQIGFTTSDPLDSRSTLYCTDVAKIVQAPIFHVNASDPEAVVYIAKLALDFRMKFKKDVVIDMVCYRKHGHSEADEPFATQPIMYQKIKKYPGIQAIYTETLIKEGVIDSKTPDKIKENYISLLDAGRSVAGEHAEPDNIEFAVDYSSYKDTDWTEPVITAISEVEVTKFTDKITKIPEGFALHPAVDRILTSRKKMGAGETLIDWGYAETMAYATLLNKGYPVRISGQDSGRGTFFHRHAVLHEQKTGETYLPLQHVHINQAPFLVINSTLSEEAVLAFEYGYSSAAPDSLVIWEAQFGDFANGAQVVFDQFISSCEAKWERYCGLVVLLPHGYDGQGPEHSSARLERWLQLCAGKNMQVCFPSTAAQMFHMLRRQILRPYRRPLIVMSPKSLLRRKLSASPIEALTQGEFQNVIDEIDEVDKEKVTRLLACSGKVYFDLLEKRRKNDIDNIVIVRIEQLFPFPLEEMQGVIESYPNLKEVVWVQEEPKNQGSWYYMQSRGTMLGCLHPHHEFGYAGRFYSASPAVGHILLHQQQQQELVNDALGLHE